MHYGGPSRSNLRIPNKQLRHSRRSLAEQVETLSHIIRSEPVQELLALKAQRDKIPTPPSDFYERMEKAKKRAA